MAALFAVTKHSTTPPSSQQQSQPDKVLCLCIGDGSTPRTAVLAAFLHPNWKCISIDPALPSPQWTGQHKTVKRLVGYACTLEQFVLKTSSSSTASTIKDDNNQAEKEKNVEHLILICVHSHARFIGHASLKNIRSLYGDPYTTLVSLPCCPRFRHVRDIGRKPDVRYDDDCVFSACRSVEIWNFDAGGGVGGE